jgi:hypothetical protein
MGFAKHAFILAMYCLSRSAIKSDEEVFDWAMKQCTVLGGDSDTNAAIVGGLIGAYVGLDKIKMSKVKKVLECRLTREGPRSQYRAKFIQPALGCIDEMCELIAIAPSSLEIVEQWNNKNLTIE